jgi:hypothetical protein
MGAATRGPAAQGMILFFMRFTARLPSPHRAKTGLVGDPDFAALDSLRSSRAKRSSQSLILVGLNEEMDTLSNPTLSAGKRGKDGAPGC